MIESYIDGGALVEKWDQAGYKKFDASGNVIIARPLTENEQMLVDKIQAESMASYQLHGYRSSLYQARELLLNYGTPQGLTYLETLSAVQTAVIEYRDSGIDDPECDKHIMWINSRVNEINSAALFASGVLE